MLRALTVKNIALIDSLEVEFSKGLNILSGETGAGKSIIIDSLGFVLGNRADKTLIRYGENQASVDAEFDDINERVRNKLDEYEIDYSEGLIISRTMSAEGRNVCRINGVKVTTAVLRDIASMLADIYGQHENNVLLNADTHIAILDAFGKEDIKEPLEEYREKYAELKEIDAKLRKYGRMDDVSGRMAKLEKEIREIEKAAIKEGEEDKLAAKLKMYESAEDILSGLSAAYNAVDGEEYCATDGVATAIAALEDITQFDGDIAECYERLEQARVELQDIGNTLSRLNSGIEFDEYEARETEERLDAIRTIESKYGDSERDVLNALEAKREEYDFYSNSEFEIAMLEKARVTSFNELMELAEKLTAARKRAAEKFAAAILEELKELGMGKTKFAVRFYEEDGAENRLSDRGADIPEFMISPNPGQPLKPLSKIISGGEMSRLMLAVKKITAEIDGVNVMVFDEIDTGISGRIAQVVANKLYDISKSRQVLAITHLPQLASMADNHYLIEKTSTDSTTNTKLVLLGGDGLYREIARLLGGDTDSKLSLMHAEELKRSANEYKTRK